MSTEEILRKIEEDPYYITKIPPQELTREILLKSVKTDPETIGLIDKNKISMELCKTAIGGNPATLRHIPEAFKNRELCELAYSIDSETVKYIPDRLKTPYMFKRELFFDPEGVLKRMPPKMMDEETAMIAIAAKPETYRLLPEHLRNKTEIILKALSKDGRMLEAIPETLYTEEMAVAALKTSGTAIITNIRSRGLSTKAIEAEMQSAKNREEMEKLKREIAEGKIKLAKETQGKAQEEAIKLNPWLISEINPKDRTYDICLKAVGTDPNTITEVPLKHRTAFLCNMAIKKDARALEYIPYEFRTRETCLYCVKETGETLAAVPEKYKDHQICLEAVKKDINAIYHVPREQIDEKFMEELLKTHKGKRNASIILEQYKEDTGTMLSEDAKITEKHLKKLKSDWEHIKKIPKEQLTDRLCLEAVRMNPEAVKYIPAEKHTNAMAEKLASHGSKGFELIPEEFKSLKLQRKAAIAEIVNAGSRDKEGENIVNAEAFSAGNIKVVDKNLENILKAIPEEEKGKYIEELEKKLSEKHIKNDFEAIEDRKKRLPELKKTESAKKEDGKAYYDIDKGELASPFKKGFLYSESEAAKYYQQYMETEFRKLEKSPVYRELKKLSQIECEELRIFSENRHVAEKTAGLLNCIRAEGLEKVVEMKGGPVSCSARSINHKSISERFEELNRIKDEKLFLAELNNTYKGKLELPKMKIQDEKLAFEGPLLRVKTEEAAQKGKESRARDSKTMAAYILKYWEKVNKPNPVSVEKYKGTNGETDYKEYHNAVIKAYLREHGDLPQIHGTRGAYNPIGEVDKQAENRAYSDHKEGYKKEKERIKDKSGKWKTVTTYKELEYQDHISEKYEGGTSQGELYALAYEASIESIKRDASKVFSLEDIFKNEPSTIIRDESDETQPEYIGKDDSTQADFQYFDEISVDKMENIENRMEKLVGKINKETEKKAETLKEKFNSLERLTDMQCELTELKTRREEMAAYLSETIKPDIHDVKQENKKEMAR